MGTPSYMPPEQAGGKRGDVGPAADVYALGATLYCTGHRPAAVPGGHGDGHRAPGHRATSRSPPRRLNATIPRDLETICLKCLEKEPAAYRLGRGAGGRPAAVPGGRADRGAAGDAARAGGEVGRRRPGDRRAAGTGRPGGGGWARGGALAMAPSGAGPRHRRTGVETGEVPDRAGRAGKRASEGQTELAEQRLYDFRMNLVQRYWEDYHGELLLKGSTSSFRPTRAASIAVVSSGSTGSERRRRARSRSRDTPTMRFRS